MTNNTTDNKTAANPIEDQRVEALRHYQEISLAAHHWSSFVEDAIKSYNPEKKGSFYLNDESGKWAEPKPPLGVVPEFIHKEQRLDDIRQAMSRFNNFHNHKKLCPQQWLDEKHYLENWLNEFNKKKEQEDKSKAIMELRAYRLIGNQVTPDNTFLCFPEEKYEAVKKAIEFVLNPDTQSATSGFTCQNTAVEVPTLDRQDNFTNWVVRIVDKGIGKEYYLPDGMQLCPWSSYVSLSDQNQEILEKMFGMLTYADIWEIIEAVNRLNIDDNNRGYLHHHFHSEWLKRAKLQSPVPENKLAKTKTNL